MAPQTVTFDVPPDLLAALKVGVGDLGRNIRLMAAITYFQDKKLSLGKAAQLAGMNRLVFMDTLAEKGLVIFDYDESMLGSELDGLAVILDPA
jgi:predicted HTH domain antitoxin